MAIQKFQLESHKIFPYIAWTVVVLFSIFVFNLVMELSTTLDQLDTDITNRASNYPTNQ